MHPDYMINAPSNRILRKAQLVAMLAKGEMASEKFVRTMEAASITGNVGIVMGQETVTPSLDSQLGRQFSAPKIASITEGFGLQIVRTVVEDQLRRVPTIEMCGNVLEATFVIPGAIARQA